MKTHNQTDLEAAGYISTGVVILTPSNSILRRVAIQHNVTIDSLACFRLGVDYWKVFFKPEVTKGFVDKSCMFCS
jgi:hypothetical protein